MSKIIITKGDTKVLFTDTLMFDGSPVDLTGATVKFQMESADKNVSQAASIDGDPTLGKVKYGGPVSATDVDTAGVYAQEWEVTFPSSGGILSFPNDTKNRVTIIEDLDPPV